MREEVDARKMERTSGSWRWSPKEEMTSKMETMSWRWRWTPVEEVVAGEYDDCRRRWLSKKIVVDGEELWEW